jgi:hypothetical protein
MEDQTDKLAEASARVLKDVEHQNHVVDVVKREVMA